MAIDLRTMGSGAAMLQNAANAGGDYYLTGAPVLLTSAVTINNRGFSLSGTGTFSDWGYPLNLKNFASISGITFDGIEVIVTADADVSYSELTGVTLTNYAQLRFATSGRVVAANTTGLVIDGMILTGAIGIRGWVEGATIKNCVVSTVADPDSSLFSGGGCNNIFEYNTVNGDRNYTEEGINFYSARNDNDLPYKQLTGNIVRNNTLYDIREEAIGYDAGHTNPWSGPITNISGSVITVTPSLAYSNPLTITNFAGFVWTFISGALTGQSFPIISNAGYVLTLSGYSGGASIGDWGIPNIQFSGNQFIDNTFSWASLALSPNGSGSTALSLWGCANNNLISGNYMDRGLCGISMSYVVNGVGGMYFPVNYNTIEDNTIDLMSNMNFFGARYYTNPAGWPVLPYSVGNIIRRNTVTLSTGAIVFVRDYQPSLVDTMFEYLKDNDVSANSFDEWTAANNSPAITNPNSGATTTTAGGTTTTAAGTTTTTAAGTTTTAAPGTTTTSAGTTTTAGGTTPAGTTTTAAGTTTAGPGGVRRVRFNADPAGTLKIKTQAGLVSVPITSWSQEGNVVVVHGGELI